MSNFKIGQKVVYVGGCTNTIMLCPEPNVEIVTILSPSSDWDKSWVLSEYPVAKDGCSQSFHERHLRPLSDIHSEWTEELVTELETEINQEQLIEA